MEKPSAVRIRPRRRYFYANSVFFGVLALTSLALALISDRFTRPEYQDERSELKWGMFCSAALGFISGDYVLAAAPSRYYLELTAEGFSEHQLMFRRSRRWRDVERFWAGIDDGPYVGFRHSEQYRSGLPPWWARLGLVASGHLFGNYGMDANDLADQLNEWRDRYAPKLIVPDDLEFDSSRTKKSARGWVLDEI